MQLRIDNVSFKADDTILTNPGDSSPKEVYSGVSENVPEDKFVSDKNTSSTKPRKTFKERVGDMWKVFATADELGKGYIKGVLWAGVAGLATAGTAWIFKALPKVFTKGGPTLKSVIKHPLKHIGRAGKIMTSLVTASVFTYNAVRAHLQKNQRTAVIDHKLNIGHRDN